MFPLNVFVVVALGTFVIIQNNIFADIQTYNNQLASIPIKQTISAPINPTPTPSSSPTPTSTPKPTKKPVIKKPSPPEPKVDQSSMTPQNLLIALNNYRKSKGQNGLFWNQTLGDFASQRANSQAQAGALDHHAGFNPILNAEGFKQMGFNSLGENAGMSQGYTATDVIEKLMAGDKPHDDNQLNSEWTHVGIGVNGAFTDFVFGGRKI